MAKLTAPLGNKTLQLDNVTGALVEVRTHRGYDATTTTTLASYPFAIGGDATFQLIFSPNIYQVRSGQSSGMYNTLDNTWAKAAF